MRELLVIVAVLGIFQQTAAAQATRAADDAATLYMQAAILLSQRDDNNIMSPSASDLVYPKYPPYPAEWQRMEQEDFAANADARALAHQARAIDHANWPALPDLTKATTQPATVPSPPFSYLNGCRNLSNELADAAVYQHLQGNDVAAIETIRDQWHLADLLRDQPKKTLTILLTSVGIRAVCVDRLEVIAAGIVLTKDPNDTKDAQRAVVRGLIGSLLGRQDAKTALADTMRDYDYGPAAATMPSATLDRMLEAVNRINTECDMAAMSLACHLYRFDNGNWPKSLDDLHAYLPSVPIDPWGDGKQTLGYVLVKAGLPDGSDRPLVYSRCLMKDGLFFRSDQPMYGFYTTDLLPDGKQGGQFRDVAGWAPPEGKQFAPATQPLR